MLIDQIAALANKGLIEDAMKVKKILDDHLSQPRMPPSDPIEVARAKAVEQHARDNPYYGPPVPGDMYYGWPISEAIKAACGPLTSLEQAYVHAEIKKRATMRMGLLPTAGSPPDARQLGPRPYTPEEKLAMRMGWGRVGDGNWASGFEHVAIHTSAASTVVHVWVISKTGQAITMEDEAALFPSDTFITKLNLLKE
jgi:hypothetical protein